MHVMVNMHVTLLLHECYMHVVQVLEMVAHVPCMLYECCVTCMLVEHVPCMYHACCTSVGVANMLVAHVTCMLYEGCNTIGAHLTICR